MSTAVDKFTSLIKHGIQDPSLETCREVLSLAAEHVNLIDDGPESVNIAGGIYAVGDRARELGDEELARDLCDAGYLYV